SVSGLFMARETVAVDTPATRATSRRPTFRGDERFEPFALTFSRVAVNWPVPVRSGSTHTVADRCHVQPRHRGTACVKLHLSKPPFCAPPESLLRPPRSEESTRTLHRVGFAACFRPLMCCLVHRFLWQNAHRRSRRAARYPAPGFRPRNGRRIRDPSRRRSG